MDLFQKFQDGRTDLVFDLANSTEYSSQRANLMSHCAYYGDVTAIRYLLERGHSLTQLGGDLGLTGAAFHGHWRLCQFLLEQSADPNFQASGTGETALHAACSRKKGVDHEYIVFLLLHYGADPNAKTIPGVDTGSFMRDVKTAGETPLHRAAAFSTKQTLEYLLQHGADKESRDIQGNSPLSWASLHGRSDDILNLLCFGDHQIHSGRIQIAAANRERGIGSMDYFLSGKVHTE